MTKEVVVTIEGYQKGAEEEVIRTTVPGTYHFTNGRHYIQYDEAVPESDAVSKNTIKIAPSQVILSKKLRHISQMVFDLEETTQTSYQTPYGNLTFDIQTSLIQLKELPERIELNMDYSLSTDNSLVSDNKIIIIIEEK